MGGVCSSQAPAPAVPSPKPALTPGNASDNAGAGRQQQLQQQQQQQLGTSLKALAEAKPQSSSPQAHGGAIHSDTPADARQGQDRQQGQGGQQERSQLERVASVGKAVAGAGLELAAKEAQDVPQAHAGSVQSASDAKAAAQETVEDHISAAAELRDRWMEGGVGENPEQLAQDADVVLDAVEKGVTFLGRLFSKDEQGPTDIQRVELKRTWLENKFAQYSTLGQVMIKMAGPAMQAFPFGAPAAALMGAVYARASQAAKLSKNCETLLALLKEVDAQLARVCEAIARQKQPPPPSMEGALQQLLQTVVLGGRQMQEYSQRGFVMRFILSSGDTQKFQSLDKRIREAMQWTSFVGVMEILSGGMVYQADESAGLREAVCKAAGLPSDEQHAQQALQSLSQSNPELLRQLLQQHGNFSMQVISVELGAISERVGVLEVKVQSLEQVLAKMDKAATRQEQYTLLAEYLTEWWSAAMGKRMRKVEGDTFCQKLVDWFREHSLVQQLLEYEEEVDRELQKAGLPASPVARRVCVQEGGRTLNFLALVVLPLADLNQDDIIERKELLNLQVAAQEFAEQAGERRPSSLNELLDVIFMGCNWEAMLAKGLARPEDQDAEFVSNGLQVRQIIQSYDLHHLLEIHVPGTRQWLFDRVNAWLEHATAPEHAASLDNRMFLLLAGPGMGKSVFSAVLEKKLVVRAYGGRTVQARHFFKVGEARREGKAMVLSLAQQLADQIPQFLKLLALAMKEHGSGSNLTMREVFEKYLLGPLAALDAEIEAQKQDKFAVVMLLDALDEASDGKKGFGAVAAFVAKEFIKLPAWVKLIVTGRPQAEQPFASWKPEWIEPNNENNQADMRLLLDFRLHQGRFVAEANMHEAIEVLLMKSQGQFIWTKYMLDELSAKDEQWTPAELQASLPEGLHGVFRHILSTLEGALQAEQPEQLVLLRQKLLPVLAAGYAPFTPEQLASITGEDLPKLELLLRLLANLYPTRAEGRRGVHKVFPYHKSVQDWMVEAAGGGIDAQLGHAAIGLTCFDKLREAATALEAAQASSGTLDADFDLQDPLLIYALRYALTHLLSAELSAQADSVLLDFNFFWPAAYTSGFGPDIVRYMSQTPPNLQSDVLQDTLRWLRFYGPMLTAHPRAALQLACDAPTQSTVSRHANQLPQRPHAKLLTKPDHWSPLLITLKGHGRPVTSVAVGGDTIVSSSEDKTIRIWDQQSGECRSILEGHSDWVTSVALSFDGRTCVSGSRDCTVRLWDLQSGECRGVLEGHSGSVRSVVLGHDGRTCVSASRDKTVRVWDLQCGECRSMLEEQWDPVSSVALSEVALSEDGKTCVSGADKSVRVWDLESGECRGKLTRHRGQVTSVALSRDGQTCVSGSEDNTVRVWDLQSGECRRELKGHSRRVTSVVLSHDGQTCVSGGDDYTVRVWDMQTGECRRVLEGHKYGVNAVAASHDGLTCMSAAMDCTIKVWDLQGGERSKLDGHRKEVISIAISQDGWTCVSASSDKTVRVWDLQSGKCRRVLEGHSSSINAVRLSQDGRTCVSVSNDKTLRVWDTESGECRSVLEGHKSAITSVALSLDGRTCVSSGPRDSTVRVWDLQGRECRSIHILEGHSDAVQSVAISQDGRTCVSGSQDCTVRVWDLQTGECRSVLEGHSSWVQSVALCHDGQTCVSESTDNTVRTWDLVKGKEVSCFDEDSPEGKQLLASLAHWRGALPGPEVTGRARQNEDRSAIFWDMSDGSAEGPYATTVYLQPSVEPHSMLLPSIPARTVSFFGKNNVFYSYKVLF